MKDNSNDEVLVNLDNAQRIKVQAKNCHKKFCNKIPSHKNSATKKKTQKNGFQIIQRNGTQKKCTAPYVNKDRGVKYMSKSSAITVCSQKCT